MEKKYFSVILSIILVFSINPVLSVISFVPNSASDIEKEWTGTCNLDYPSVIFGCSGYYKCGSMNGLRFQLNVPQGATIDTASLRLKVYGTSGSNMPTIIRVENSVNCEVYNEATCLNRPLMAQNVIWSASGTIGNYMYSPSIVNLVQSIVNKPGWVSGNYICFHVLNNSADTGFQTFTAYSYDGTAVNTDRPRLYVLYTEPTTTTTSTTTTSTSTTTTTIPITPCDDSCTNLGYIQETCDETVAIPSCANGQCRYEGEQSPEKGECSSYCYCWNQISCTCGQDTCDEINPYCHVTIITTSTLPPTTTTTVQETTTSTQSITTTTSPGTTTTILGNDFEFWTTRQGIFTVGIPTQFIAYVQNIGSQTDTYTITYDIFYEYQGDDLSHLIQVDINSDKINNVESLKVGDTQGTIIFLGQIFNPPGATITFTAESENSGIQKQTSIPISSGESSGFPLTLPEFSLIGFVQLFFLVGLVIFYSFHIR